MKTKEDILDDFYEDENKMRLLAVTIEILPLIIILGLARYWDDSYFLLAIYPVMALIYLLFGWYIFQGEKFSIVEMAITIVFGLYFLFCLYGLQHIILSWEGGRELINYAIYIGAALDVGLLIWYLKNRHKKLEYRFSLKLLSRVLLFQLFVLS